MPFDWFKWLGLERRTVKASPFHPASIPLPRHDFLPVLSSTALLATPTRRQHLQDIERLAGIPVGHFNLFYRAAIEAYASWVQQLPASEAHHHAGPGGMLDHALEVTTMAMARRRVHLLPHGADPETISRHQHRWTYAVFSAALLHDVGKPAVDQHVMILDGARREHGPWDPWSGPMPQEMWYRVAFIRGRRYRMHETVAPLLARLILPQQGLSWLAQDHEVLREWLAAVNGDRDNRGVVAKIVEQADCESVARNLGAGDATRFPSARAIPLYERLLTGLRHLLSTGVLPLNRNGSAGWLVGEDLWLIPKRAVDILRDHLLQEGHSGIPSHNERIFDELQEHGLLTPNGEQAIWKGQVAGDGWSHSFTLLRFRASRIWSDSSQRPEPFSGTVTPMEMPIEPSVTTEEKLPPGEVSEPSPAPLIETTQPFSDDWQKEETWCAPSSSSDEPPAVKATAREKQNEKDEAIGTEFLNWLIEGAAKGRIRINKADARLHIVPEGLLLVSPGIFRDYARAINQPHAWDRAQGGFCRLGLHRRAEDDTNIFRYKVELPDGNHDKSTHTLKGIVMMDPQIVIKEEIQPNPILRRTE